VAPADDEDRIDALLATVGHLPDDERAAASVGERSRRRWQRQQAAEATTMAGVLLGLAERHAEVTLRCGPWAHQGRLRTVTVALTIIEVAEGVALVPTESVTAVEAATGVADDRVPAAGLDLTVLLAALVPERPPVRLLVDDGTEVAGTLMDMGKDVAVVRRAGAVVTVRLAALAGCVLPGRGNDASAGRDQDDESGAALGSTDDFGSG
jgi:hypothetical protein